MDDTSSSSFFMRSPLFAEVLTYLSTHPQAQDTVEGIVAWWLLKQRILHQTRQVKAVLAELVARDWVLERRDLNGRVSYRVNKLKAQEIQRALAAPNDCLLRHRNVSEQRKQNKSRRVVAPPLAFCDKGHNRKS